MSAPGGKPKSQSLLIGSPGPPTVVVGNSDESALFVGSEIRRQQGRSNEIAALAHEVTQRR